MSATVIALATVLAVVLVLASVLIAILYARLRRERSYSGAVEASPLTPGFGIFNFIPPWHPAAQITPFGSSPQAPVFSKSARIAETKAYGAYITLSPLQNSSLGRTCASLIGTLTEVGSSLKLDSRRTTNCLVLNPYGRRSSLARLVLPNSRRVRTPSRPPTGPPVPPPPPQGKCWQQGFRPLLLLRRRTARTIKIKTSRFVSLVCGHPPSLSPLVLFRFWSHFVVA